MNSFDNQSEQLTYEMPRHELRHLDYRRFHPHPALTPWIECYWSISVNVLPGKVCEEKLYPDGGVSITFNFPEQAYGQWVGVSRNLHQATIAGNVESFGIRFKPGGAQWLLQTSLAELSEGPYALRDFPLQGIETLAEELKDTQNLDQRVLLANRWLLMHQQLQQPTINIAQHCISLCLQNNLSLNQWCASQGVTRRKLERNFQQTVGLPPGQLKTFFRVKRARALIKDNLQRSLTDIALHCGYYDQAHFIRQFHRVTGQTPGEYRERQRQRLALGQLTPSFSS